MSENVEVALDLDGETVQVGIARIDRRRNTLTTNFRYATEYLARPSAYAIDPAIPLDAGGGVANGLPGAFSDCAPDRWGRRLIMKRIRASERGSTPRALSELDYLLGVSDVTRQGALRFRRTGETEYADPQADIPKVIRLPELLHAADQVDRDDIDLSAIKVLLDAGTGTLGGARPKASVVGDDGLLYIAKFPKPTDEWDVMGWEKTALDLAEAAGIGVPKRRIAAVDGRTVLLLERFDRVDGHRIGYISAMTLLNTGDGVSHDYVELAADLADVSASADRDLEDLWRRIAFSVAIHNTDDHLRNHGVLRDGSGWSLSPVFDVNPNPDVAEPRVTSIAWTSDRFEEIGALMSSASEFGLNDTRARQILREVEQATRDWRDVAARNGISGSECAQFEGAFEDLREAMKSVSTAAIRKTHKTGSGGSGRIRGVTPGLSTSRGSFKSNERPDTGIELRPPTG